VRHNDCGVRRISYPRGALCPPSIEDDALF